MRWNLPARYIMGLVLAAILAFEVSTPAQTSKPQKVYMITDMEGVDGVFSLEDQAEPFKSPRWEESRRLLTDEVNAAVNGLYEGGATEVTVLDGHDSSRTLSALDIDPRVRLLAGIPISPTFEIDASYSALVFIGQHALAGSERGILSHSFDSQHIQNIWVNNVPTGEIGTWVMVAGSFGVPTIMLSGDAAACNEVRQLVPEAECAEVKSGVSRTAGFALSHPVACALIREKARRAMEHLSQFKPYKIPGPVEVKVEFTTVGTRPIRLRPGMERLNERTYVFRGKDIVEAWLNWP